MSGVTSVFVFPKLSNFQLHATLEVLDVIAVDLVERRIAGTAGLTRLRPPLPILRALLREQRQKRQQSDQQDDRKPAEAVGSSPFPPNMGLKS